MPRSQLLDEARETVDAMRIHPRLRGVGKKRRAFLGQRLVYLAASQHAQEFAFQIGVT